MWGASIIESDQPVVCAHSPHDGRRGRIQDLAQAAGPGPAREDRQPRGRRDGAGLPGDGNRRSLRLPDRVLPDRHRREHPDQDRGARGGDLEQQVHLRAGAPPPGAAVGEGEERSPRLPVQARRWLTPRGYHERGGLAQADRHPGTADREEAAGVLRHPTRRLRPARSEHRQEAPALAQHEERRQPAGTPAGRGGPAVDPQRLRDAAARRLDRRGRRRGRPGSGGRETLDVTLEDLWSVIDDLLANDEYERALQVARDARRRWPDVARFYAAYAWVVWVGWQAEFFIRTPLFEEAVTEAERALRDAVAEPRSAERLATWDSRIGPLLALERPAKALDAARDAQAALGGLPSQLRVHRAEALVLTGRPDDGMVEAIQLRRLHRVRVAAPPQPRPLPARLADLRQGTQGRRRGLEPHRPDRVREIGPPGHRKQAAMEQVTHACMTDGCQRQGQATFSRWCQACGLPNEAGSSAGGAQSGQPPWSADPVGPAARAASSPVPADGHGSGAVAITVVGLIPGYDKTDPVSGKNRFFQDHRISEVTWRFDDGTSVDQQFTDDPSMQRQAVDVTSATVTIEIVATLPSEPGFDYTPISDVSIMGTSDSG